MLRVSKAQVQIRKQSNLHVTKWCKAFKSLPPGNTMRAVPEVRRIPYTDVLKHVILGFLLLVGLAMPIYLTRGSIPSNIWIVALGVLVFMFIDVTGIDGGAVYALTRLLGSHADYDDHVSYVARWKPYVFALQALGIVVATINVSWGLAIYYAFIIVELVYFGATFRLVHRFDWVKTAAMLLIIFAVMAPTFLAATDTTTMIELAEGRIKATGLL